MSTSRCCPLRSVLPLLLCAVLPPLSNCGGFVVTGSSANVSITGKTMGTTYSVKCWSRNDVEFDTMPLDIQTLLDKINEQMSTYLPDSELSRFNQSQAGDWFAVSPETAFVTSEALRYHELTDGASDVTVGPLVRLWDFGPGRHEIGSELETPSDDALAEAKAKTGAAKLEVKLEPPTLKKQIEGLEVDLSSIAKGYAVDAVSELVAERGYENFMVEIGGEVRAAGKRQDGQPWKIGIESPNLEERRIYQVVALADLALATSGDYRNFREFDGQRVSHIIDPRSGRPLPYRGWSVTVLAPTCLEADALATALLVRGEDEGYDWCEQHKVAALFLIRQQDQVQERATPRFLELSPVVEQPSER